MFKKVMVLSLLISLCIVFGFAQTGTYTTNDYFYLPLYGAHGTAEFNEYNTYMEIADNQIEANRTDILIASQYATSGTGTSVDPWLGAIQPAIDALPSTGGIIYLPSGVYKITSTITVNKRCKVFGSVRVEDETASSPVIILKDGDFTGIAITTASVVIDGLTVKGDSGNGGDGIQIKANGCTLQHVSVIDQGGIGIRIGDDSEDVNCNSWRLIDVVARNNTSHGILIDDAGVSPDANAGIATGLFCHGNGGDGLKVDRSQVNNFHGVLAQSNTGVGVRVGASARNNTFWNSHCEGNTSDQFVFDATSTNNLLIGSMNYNATDNGINVVIRNAGGTSQQLKITRKLVVPFIKHEVITVTDGDATPDISGGEIFITSSNTGATEITDLDLPTVGQIVTLVGGSNTNSSTITDGGNFSLEGNWTASLDKVLYLFVQADNDYVEIGRSAGGGYTNLTSFVEQTAWRVFYSNTDGDVIELALGADGTYLKSNGAAVAPTFATPAGAGDVSKVGTPADSQVGVWTGDGTIEGAASLTYDGSNFQLTGDIGATGARITKGWFADLQVTNAIAGSITGNAVTFTCTDNESEALACPLVFVDGATGAQGAETDDTDFTYNPSTGTLKVTALDLTTALPDAEVANNITIDLATLATTITVTDNEATAENNPLCFVAGADPDGGSLGIETDGDLHYNPSTGLLTATGFAGALTGNVTGNCSGSSGSCTGNAATCTTASAGDAAVGFFGAGVDAVTDATTCTNIEGTLLSITTGTLNAAIPADHITYDKMQDTSATDKILGRSTAGAGTIEEIACTAAGRAILDDADASAQRTTLGLVIGTNVEVDLSNEAGLYAVLSDVALFLEDTIDDTSPELGGEMDCGAHSIGFTQQTVTYNVTTTTVDWTNGNKATMTFGAGNIGTFAFTNPSNPCNVLLMIIQDGTGSRVVTAWDADIKWAGGTAPTLTTTANGIDICSFYWNGTNYFGVASLAFATP